MDFSPSPRAEDLTARVRAFIDTEIEPVEPDYQREITRLRESGGDAWTPLPIIKELQDKARAQGLWNLFLPVEHAGDYAERFGTDGGAGLSNVDYAPIAEQTGRSFIAPLVFNCNAPDTGNMEVLLKYGSDDQRATWLEPLLDGRIRSGFAMTEPDVASSDATNMAATAVVDGDEVVVNGTKWWTTGAGNPDCKIFVFMGLTDPDADRHARHTMVLVPRDAPGVKVERKLTAMGMYDEPLGHAEVSFTDVRVPAANVLLGPGRAFEIAQGRLGPGRVHHCMRLIGLAEKALELACRRAITRVAFGRPLAKLGGNAERIADARIAIDQARLLVHHAAWKLDTAGSAGSLKEVSQIKVAVPNMAQQVIDMAMQLHGGAGVSEDFPLAAAWTSARTLRLADGPDEVHRGVIAKLELKKHLVSHVLVTGAASGLGAALTSAFLARGDEVLATDVAPPSSDIGGRAEWLRLDVRSDEDWAAALDRVEERWGGLDVLVNNAGVAGGGRVDLCTMDEWAWLTDINLFGVVRGARTFAPLLKQQGSGRIVNVASLAGLVHPPGMGAYNAVKAAVVAFSETLAHELAPYGVGCSAVCPSYFRTNLTASMRGSDPDVAAKVAAMVEQSPISAEDIAAAVLKGIDQEVELIIPDGPARTAYQLKRADRHAYDTEMRRTAARMKERSDA